jgi:CspA family cold shock protein
MKGSVMAIGTVKWFNSKKRYGFIVPDEGGKDVFVHMTAIEQSGMAQLVEGQRVNFKILNEPRGLQAVDLSPADDVEESAEAADQEEAEAADPEEAEAADQESAKD